MKTKIQLFTLLICLMVFASCKKKSTTPAPAAVTPTAGAFTCKLSGTSWTADSAVYINNGTQTFIMAYKGGRMQLEINLAGVVTGNYPVSTGTNDFIYWPALTSFSGANNGSVVITLYDNGANQVSGTFGPLDTAGPGGSFSFTDGVFTKIPRRA